MKTLLIIGASGFVGAELATRAATRYRVLTPSPEALDITDPAAIEREIAAARPDLVALVAAIADIDICEQQPELARRVNAEGPRLVAEACAACGARLVYISSAAVYDGMQEGYFETDPPTPVSVYGRTKAEAERAVLSRLPDSILVRPALVLGSGRSSGTNSFQDKLLATFAAGKTVTAPVFEFRNPIDVGTLTEAMLRLAANPEAAGVYHLGATVAISRFDLACCYASKTGAKLSQIAPQLELPAGRAPRGLHHFLLSDRLEAHTGLLMPDLDTVLERAIHGFTESTL